MSIQFTRSHLSANCLESVNLPIDIRQGSNSVCGEGSYMHFPSPYGQLFWTISCHVPVQHRQAMICSATYPPQESPELTGTSQGARGFRGRQTQQAPAPVGHNCRGGAAVAWVCWGYFQGNVQVCLLVHVPPLVQNVLKLRHCRCILVIPLLFPQVGSLC